MATYTRNSVHRGVKWGACIFWETQKTKCSKHNQPILLHIWVIWQNSIWVNWNASQYCACTGANFDLHRQVHKAWPSKHNQMFNTHSVPSLHILKWSPFELKIYDFQAIILVTVRFCLKLRHKNCDVIVSIAQWQNWKINYEPAFHFLWKSHWEWHLNIFEGTYSTRAMARTLAPEGVTVEFLWNAACCSSLGMESGNLLFTNHL